MATSTSNPQNDLCSRARRLGLYGLVDRWDELGEEPWIEGLLDKIGRAHV